MLQKKILIALLLPFLSSCSSGLRYYPAYYDMSLNVIEPSNKLINLGSKKKINMIDNKDFFSYNNKDFSLQIKPAKQGFYFKVLNKTDKNIKIIWDNSAIINENNETIRLFHYGTKFTDGDKTQLPSIIVKNTTLNEFVTPQASINEGRYGYSVDPYFTSYVYGNVGDNELKEMARKIEPKLKTKFIDKTIKLLLTLEVNDKQQEYMFNFLVNDINFDLNESLNGEDLND